MRLCLFGSYSCVPGGKVGVFRGQTVSTSISAEVMASSTLRPMGCVRGRVIPPFSFGLLWLGQIHVAHDVLGCQCRHEFSDSNSWTASANVPPKELHWLPCTYWRLGWCKMPRGPVWAQRCGCCQVVLNWYWMLWHTQYIHNSLERTMVGYSISSVSLSPPHFKCAITQRRLRASLHWVFSALMCSKKVMCESHHSPRNFVDSSTGRSVSLILIVGVCGLCVGVQWNVQLYIYGLQTWNHSLLPIPVWHLLPAVDVFL